MPVYSNSNLETNREEKIPNNGFRFKDADGQMYSGNQLLL